MTFFVLLDDVASLLDDTATMTKVAAKKTASVLGDDLAVNAEQASGFSAKRELVAIKKIAIGAIKNKVILLPIIFLLSYILPIAIIWLLICGGLFLAYEGSESIIESIMKKWSKKKHEDNESDFSKIKGAIKTDFVLSIEIIVIAFSIVMDKPFVIQIITVTIIAFAAVMFVYGTVAMIVRLDDIGLILTKKGYPKIGIFLIHSLTWIIKSLKLIGVIAMFMVAGSIFAHNIHILHEFFENFKDLNVLIITFFESLIAIVTGFIIVLIIQIYKKFLLLIK